MSGPSCGHGSETQLPSPGPPWPDTGNRDGSCRAVHSGGEAPAPDRTGRPRPRRSAACARSAATDDTPLADAEDCSSTTRDAFWDEVYVASPVATQVLSIQRTQASWISDCMSCAGAARRRAAPHHDQHHRPALGARPWPIPAAGPSPSASQLASAVSGRLLHETWPRPDTPVVDTPWSAQRTSTPGP